MDLPQNINLPFFTYGIFKPGELAFLSIHEYVHSFKRCSSKGILRIRDGLPILDKDGYDNVEGYIIHFRNDSIKKGYSRIIEIEPDKQYEWGTGMMNEEKIEANILFAKVPENGSIRSDYSCYNGNDDPLFSDAMTLIEDMIKDPENLGHDNYYGFFKLQMAYLLLWTIIERYTSLRYMLSGSSRKKYLKLATDPIFCDQLKQNVERTEKIYRANDPRQGKAETLNPENPKSSLDYYYQIRSNITHRGKAAFKDFNRLEYSLKELFYIMKATIDNAFEQSIVQN